jgi:maltose-binding protein MalE
MPRKTSGLSYSIWTLCILFGLILGCRSAQPAASVTPSPIPASPQPAPAATITTPEALLFEQRPLTIWVPYSFSSFIERGPDSFIAATVHQFERRHPQLRVEFVIKADEGDASLFNFLRSAYRVAPAILPDMILFDTRQLWPIIELGLLQPIRTDQMTNNDGFFPFAMQAVMVDEQQYAIP